MKIEIWTDVMCPHCHVGKILFQRALDQFVHADEIEIILKAFQLNNELLNDGKGIPMTEYLQQMVGMSDADLEKSFSYLSKRAEMCGVKFNVQNAVATNTRDAHRLIKLASERGLDSKVLGLLTKSFFEDAENCSNRDFLVQLGTNAGLNPDDIRDMLASDKYHKEVEQDMEDANALGVDTVPTFLFNRKDKIIGAKQVDKFLEVLNLSYDNWKSGESTTGTVSDKGEACGKDGKCKI